MQGFELEDPGGPFQRYDSMSMPFYVVSVCIVFREGFCSVFIIVYGYFRY